MHTTALVALAMLAAAPLSAQRRVPKSLSGVRGANYQSAPTVGHTELFTIPTGPYFATVITIC